MVAVDSTFLIDVLRGHREAVRRLEGLVSAREPRFVSPPAVCEVLVGAHLGGAKQLRAAEGLLSTFQRLEFDEEACLIAGRVGADLVQAGEALAGPDLFIAAIALRHGQPLVTRDRAFARVRGLRVETY